MIDGVVHVRVLEGLNVTMDEVVAVTMHKLSVVLESLWMIMHLSCVNGHGLLVIELQVRFLVAALACIHADLFVVGSDWLTSLMRDGVHLDFVINVLLVLLLVVRFLLWLWRGGP